MEPSFENLLMERLNSLESKIDKVRTEDLPKVKLDVAVLINENKNQSKLHSFLGAMAAIVVSAIIPHR